MFARKMTRYAVVMIVVYVLLMAMTFINGMGDGLIGKELPLGIDFIAYWTASGFALDGSLAAAFDPDVFQAAKNDVIAGTGYGFLWLYPPTFALFIIPLALLPYILAYVLWILIGIGVTLLMLYRYGADRHVTIYALAVPFVYLALFHGQNSLFVMFFFAMAGYCLSVRRDIEAGAWIALILIKPHLGILLPFALALTGRWRAFLAASGFCLAFLGVSTAVFGLDYWVAFLEYRDMPLRLLEEGEQQGALVSVFAFLRSLGNWTPLGHEAVIAIAYAGHWMCALAAAIYALALCRRDGLSDRSIAVMMIASLTISPYMFYYDLAVLIPAGLLFWRRSLSAGQGPDFSLARLENKLLLAVLFLPLCLTGISKVTGLAVGCAIALVCLALAARRMGGVPGFFLAADKPRASV